MNKDEFKELIRSIVSQADVLKKKYVTEIAPVNYACIFCQNNEEYSLFQLLAKELGEIIEDTKTWPLFLIEPLSTVAGNLRLLKVRHPDQTRPERGDADFTLKSYDQFKEENLSKIWFSLIVRESFEMIELVEDNYPVRVYFSNPPLDQNLNIQ